jgi:hypothetical protein
VKIILVLAFLAATGVALVQQDAAADYRKQADASAVEAREWRKAAMANAMTAYKHEGRLIDCLGLQEL